MCLIYHIHLVVYTADAAKRSCGANPLFNPNEHGLKSVPESSALLVEEAATFHKYSSARPKLGVISLSKV